MSRFSAWSISNSPRDKMKTMSLFSCRDRAHGGHAHYDAHGHGHEEDLDVEISSSNAHGHFHEHADRQDHAHRPSHEIQVIFTSSATHGQGHGHGDEHAHEHTHAHEHEHAQEHALGHEQAHKTRHEDQINVLSPSSETKLVASYRCRGTERNVVRILLEVYNPRLLLWKLTPICVLRVGKLLALLFNEVVGRLFCGWQAGESRVLDFVGRGTKRMCHELYGEDVDEAFVNAFLVRRFIFCMISTAATLIQIGMQLSTSPQYAAVTTAVLIPLYIDRQFATLVTKMAPRHDRSLLLHFLATLTETLRKPFSELVQPRLVRPACTRGLLGCLTVLEMCVSAVQFQCGLLLSIYMLLLLGDRFAWWSEHQVPRFFRTNAVRQCALPVCFDVTISIVTLRCVKELCNWLSPLIEYWLTSIKYQAIAQLANGWLEGIVEQVGGAEKLAAILASDMHTRNACAAVGAQFLLERRREGEKSVPEKQRKKSGVKEHLCALLACRCGWSEKSESGRVVGLPMLPIYLQSIPFRPLPLQVLELLCWCMEDEWEAHAAPDAGMPLDSSSGGVCEEEELLQETRAEEHQMGGWGVGSGSSWVFRMLFLYEHEHVFDDGTRILHRHGRLQPTEEMSLRSADAVTDAASMRHGYHTDAASMCHADAASMRHGYHTDAASMRHGHHTDAASMRHGYHTHVTEDGVKFSHEHEHAGGTDAMPAPRPHITQAAHALPLHLHAHITQPLSPETHAHTLEDGSVILHAHTLPEAGRYRHTHDTKLQHNTAIPVLPPVLQAGGDDIGVATTDAPHSPAADQARVLGTEAGNAEEGARLVHGRLVHVHVLDDGSKILHKHTEHLHEGQVLEHRHAVGPGVSLRCDRPLSALRYRASGLVGSMEV